MTQYTGIRLTLTEDFDKVTVTTEQNDPQLANDIFKSFYKKENFKFWIKIWSLFLGVQLTRSKHWFSLLLGTEQDHCHYMINRHLWRIWRQRSQWV